MKNWSKNNGFSLLEIMISVAILSTAILVILSAQGNALRSSERAERMTNATILARQKMTEVEMEFSKDLAKNKFPDDDVVQEGEFAEPFQDFRWRYAVKKVEIPVASEPEGTNALVGGYVKGIMEQISKSVRQVEVTILWGDPELPPEEQPKYTVTTHWVKMK